MISADAVAVPEGTSEPITLTFYAQAAQIVGNELVVQDLTSNEALPTFITALAPLTIDWAIETQFQDQPGFALSGTRSSHLIYVMRAPAVNPSAMTRTNSPLPNPAEPYVTVVSLTVEAALGLAADDEQGVFDAIWSAFAEPSLSRITRRDLDPVRGQVTPGEKLHYWTAWSLSDILQGEDFLTTQQRNCPVLTVRDLLSTTVGKCGAWANFFADALGVQGLPSTLIDEVFYLDDPAVGSWSALGFPADATFMLVDRQAWQFSSPNSSTAGYPYQVTTRASPFAYLEEGVRYVPDGTPLGQGNTSPPGLFTTGDHALVLYANKLFDPSYGHGPFDSIGQWATQSLAGYATFSPGSAQGKGALACPIPGGICTFHVHKDLPAED
jgi:hypothetical protein